MIFKCFGVLLWLRLILIGGSVSSALAANHGGLEAVGNKEQAKDELAESQPLFDILDFQVEGNSVLDTLVVEEAIYAFLGPDKGVEDVEKARQALEASYRDRGYPTVVVEIPEQNVDGGVVRLQVVEGSVEIMNITGSRYYSLGKIRAGVPSLAEGKVPYMPAVQDQISRLVKESADREVTPIFRAGSTPGKMEVELQVKDELPLHGSVELNGRNSEHTSRTRLSAALRYDNLWQKFHSVSLQFQVSPETSEEVEVWSGTYALPMGWADSRLALYGIGVGSTTQVGASIGATTVVGSGSIYGLRWMLPLPGADDYSQSLTIGFDYKDFNQDIKLVGQDTGNTPIQYAPFQFAYDGVVRGEDWATNFNMAGHVSLRGLVADSRQFENKRHNARANYVYFNSDFKHQQRLYWGFQLAFRASGQVSGQPLISNEQFAAGGAQSVRGYYQTQQLGDSGLNLSLELHSPNWIPDGWETLQALHAVVFVDWASLWVHESLPRNPGRYLLAGSGLGLRAQIFKRLMGELDWSYPFYKQGSVDVGQQRIDFRMAYEF